MRSIRMGTFAVALATTAILSFQNCSNQGFVSSSYIDETGYKPMDSLGERCKKPWDSTSFIDADQSLIAYFSGAVAEGQNCFAQERVCVAGKLTGTFERASCMILPNNQADCTGAWSGAPVVRNNTTVTAYLVQENGSCIPENRTCTNGVLSGTASLAACPSNLACRTPWGFVLGEGQVIDVLDDKGTPAPAGTCGKQVYTYSCRSQTLETQVATPGCGPAACRAPWGTMIANGSSTRAYKAYVVPGGESCTASTNIQTRTCSNGTLSGSYSYSGCSVAKKDCAVPWSSSKTIKHGEGIIAWRENSTPGVNNCQYETRLCNDGVLSGSYGFETCGASTRDCKTPWGSTVKNLERFQAWNREAGSDSNPCLNQEVQCVDSRLTAHSYQYESCIMNPKSCSLNGKTVRHGESGTFYVNSNNCNGKSRRCNNGVLGGDTNYNLARCNNIFDNGGGGGSN